MDKARFDELTRVIGTQESRRGVLSTAAKGGVAALLAAVGISAFDTEAEAAVKCGKKCRRRKGRGKKRCLRNCRKGNQRRRAQRRKAAQRRRRASNQISTPIGVGPVAIGGACTAPTECASGNCSVGFCASCDGIRLCGDRCCLVDASCVAGLCVRL